jgi:hypothetical protein
VAKEGLGTPQPSPLRQAIAHARAARNNVEIAVGVTSILLALDEVANALEAGGRMKEGFDETKLRAVPEGEPRFDTRGTGLDSTMRSAINSPVRSAVERGECKLPDRGRITVEHGEGMVPLEAWLMGPAGSVKATALLDVVVAIAEMSPSEARARAREVLGIKETCPHPSDQRYVPNGWSVFCRLCYVRVG